MFKGLYKNSLYYIFVRFAPFAIQILNPQVKRAGKKGQISHAFFNFMLHFHFLIRLVCGIVL